MCSPAKCEGMLRKGGNYTLLCLSISSTLPNALLVPSLHTPIRKSGLDVAGLGPCNDSDDGCGTRRTRGLARSIGGFMPTKSSCIQPHLITFIDCSDMLRSIADQGLLRHSSLMEHEDCEAFTLALNLVYTAISSITAAKIPSNSIKGGQGHTSSSSEADFPVAACPRILLGRNPRFKVVESLLFLMAEPLVITVCHDVVKSIRLNKCAEHEEESEHNHCKYQRL